VSQKLITAYKEHPAVRQIISYFVPGHDTPENNPGPRTGGHEPGQEKDLDAGSATVDVSGAYRETAEEERQHRRFRLQLNGLVGSSAAMVAAAVHSKTPGGHFVVLPDKEMSAYFFNDLQQLAGERVFYFPSSYKRGFAAGIKDNQGLLSRTEVLNILTSGIRKFIIVSYPEAIAEKVVNKKFLTKNTLKLSTGEQVNMDFILELLVEYEFERTDFVVEPGQFSIRGGLVDVFSFSCEHPYRIEFSGDSVASLRTFDPSTQLSLKQLEELTIIPDIRVNPDRKITYEPIFAFLPERTAVWLSDTPVIAGKADQSGSSELLLTGGEILRLLLDFSTLEFGHDHFFRKGQPVSFNTVPQPSFNKDFNLLFSDLSKNRAGGYSNILVTDNPKQAERLERILEDLRQKLTINNGQLTVDQPDNKIVNCQLSIVNSEGLFLPLPLSLHEGFIDRDLKLALYTDHQIFERYHKFQLRDGYAGKEALSLKELYNLKPGDYVTHIDHGIGRFDGLEKIVNNGKEQEAIRLIYKNDDLLYVSIHSLHRISKYIGKEGTAPVLNRLGSDVWNKLKDKTKSRVKDIARELIKLYAERRASKGLACAPDTYLQAELEASFIYEDTPDQIRATADVKRDLEEAFPMDRLICGDVGFGKTEIAIRAAFKVVTESKQVAILVPTTILALQHYKTFADRLKAFPCRVDYLNRFRSAADQKKILADLKEGKIDILIGTHRLLSKDIEFWDLGLLIIDEEQKFGVSSKEKIKQMKVNVDTLTLTATPIPRTLQFSLMGARDLSVINTPPPNRYPVQTELHPFSEEVIREAIKFEVSRGGQVFFVNTRVMNIMDISAMVQRMVPGVKVAVAHGQMEGHRLERVMADFIEGEYDVLIATTIIESGLDISNVNTILINDAHHYGLSDLHQLRGRVGRSNKKAFCYLLAPPMSTLTDEARKRLRAIEEFSELGSGFNIAMRDLDIRGAGNILGAEQSGFITEIGYEMYQKILDEALLELRESEPAGFEVTATPVEFTRECVIETDLEVLIPDHYVTSITERLNLYKELDSISTEENLGFFMERLIDRFGPVPHQTQDLLHTIRLRWLARRMGFEKVALRNERLTAYFISNPESPYFQSKVFTAILDFMKENPSYLAMKEDRNRLFITIREVPGVIEALHKLERIAGEKVTNI
jgi:transcription-repair coupling factor (superfamily II helicase)